MSCCAVCIGRHRQGRSGGRQHIIRMADDHHHWHQRCGLHCQPDRQEYDVAERKIRPADSWRHCGAAHKHSRLGVWPHNAAGEQGFVHAQRHIANWLSSHRQGMPCADAIRCAQVDISVAVRSQLST